MVYRASLGMDAIRAKRDRLLAESDWTQVEDNGLSNGMRKAWQTYRAELRDITSQPLASLRWPIIPTAPEAVEVVIEKTPAEQAADELKDMFKPGEAPTVGARRMMDRYDELHGWDVDKVPLTPAQRNELTDLGQRLKPLRTLLEAE